MSIDALECGDSDRSSPNSSSVDYISDMTNAPTQRTVIFAGGGTGGHLFPGISVARESQTRDPEMRVLFVGSQKPIERDIVGGAGFEHVAMPCVSPSFAPTRIVSSLLNNWRAYRQACVVIARERPSVVVGLGGFASVPPVLAAWRAGVPIVLLEQNVVPGKATRWLGRLAKVVCLPWEQATNGLPRGVKTVVTGNPIRAEIAKLADAACGRSSLPLSLREGRDEDAMNDRRRHLDNAPDDGVNRDIVPHPAFGHLLSEGEGTSSRRSTHSTLLILGGSQGAASLNALVLDAFANRRAELTGWRIVHQTGAADLDAIRQRYAAMSLDADVQPFIADMSTAYRCATLVISRAGATTLAELACAGVPAILVPLATSAHDHQRLNARLFSDHSAALVSESPASLADSLDRLLCDPLLRDQLRQNLRVLAQPQAACAVATILEHVVSTSRGFK